LRSTKHNAISPGGRAIPCSIRPLQLEEHHKRALPQPRGSGPWPPLTITALEGRRLPGHDHAPRCWGDQVCFGDPMQPGSGGLSNRKLDALVTPLAGCAGPVRPVPNRLSLALHRLPIVMGLLEDAGMPAARVVLRKLLFQEPVGAWTSCGFCSTSSGSCSADS
jgi:hypothetical protein